MNKTTEALKLAEEAILTPYPGIRTSHSDYLAYHERMKKALAAIREALAETVKQEPVAVISESAIGLVKLHSNGACLPFGTQLYAAPVHPMQEPVAWRYNSNGDWIYKDRKVWDAAEPLYTALVDAKAIRAEECERICAAIKAEDDYCIDNGDYMLDSNDCIKVARGEWVRPEFDPPLNDKSAAAIRARGEK